MIDPTALGHLTDFVKNMTPAFGSGFGVWVWRAWRQRREDQHADDDDARRDSLSKALDDRLQRDLARMEKRNAMLEEQHAVDIKAVYTYQNNLNLYKHEMIFLRTQFDEYRRAHGESGVAWAELPALPQPMLNDNPPAPGAT